MNNKQPPKIRAVIHTVPYQLIIFAMSLAPICASGGMGLQLISIPAGFALCLLSAVATYLAQRAYWTEIGMVSGTPADLICAEAYHKAAYEIAQSRHPALAQLLGPGLPHFPWMTIWGAVGYGSALFLVALAGMNGAWK